MAQNWQYATPVPVGGSVTYGGGSQAIQWLDPMDAARSMQGNRLPQAQYPDGYLGTIQSRRDQRLMNSLTARANQKSYDRGVHKGERVDPGDYFLPPRMAMDSRLAEPAEPAFPLQYVARAAPQMSMNELLVVRGSQSLRDPRSWAPTLRPNWS
jgi:hypothetical protein